MTRALLVAIAVVAVVAIDGCSPGDAGCNGPAACGDVGAAPCERCAPLATSLCVDGACAARDADAVDVSIDVSLERHLTSAGFVWAIAAADRACSDLGSFSAFPADLNALASGQKTLSGGTFHPDVQLGRAPGGDLLILGLATSAAGGDGDVQAHGCLATTATTPGGLTNSQLDLNP